MLRTLKSLISRNVILFVVALAILPATVVHAEGFTRMGLIQRIPISGTAVLDTISGGDGNSANDMAKGYLMWTAAGNEFWVRRNTSTRATFETNSLKVPSDQQLVLTPLQAVKSGDSYYHVLEFTGAAADTLFRVQLWR
jgi:hypothetical protein